MRIYTRGEQHPSWRGGRSLNNGYVRVRHGQHPRADANGAVFEHILVVERALGHYLRRGAEIHHVDENRSNNANANLVACDSSAYHKLLHQRTRAYLACGDASARRCCFCRGYDRQGDIAATKANNAYHRDCHVRNTQEWRRRKAQKEYGCTSDAPDDYRSEWLARGWTEVNCGCCAGTEWGGESPRECRTCGGDGAYWRSPKGALALYPGGPFVGSEPIARGNP